MDWRKKHRAAVAYQATALSFVVDFKPPMLIEQNQTIIVIDIGTFHPYTPNTPQL
jgi:hypothetical protein